MGPSSCNIAESSAEYLARIHSIASSFKSLKSRCKKGSNIEFNPAAKHLRRNEWVIAYGVGHAAESTAIFCEPVKIVTPRSRRFVNLSTHSRFFSIAIRVKIQIADFCVGGALRASILRLSMSRLEVNCRRPNEVRPTWNSIKPEGNAMAHSLDLIGSGRFAHLHSSPRMQLQIVGGGSGSTTRGKAIKPLHACKYCNRCRLCQNVFLTDKKM
jgi:hypothetical protein